MAGSTPQPEQSTAVFSRTFSLKTLMLVVTGACVFMAIARVSPPLVILAVVLSVITVPASFRTIWLSRRLRLRGESFSLPGYLVAFVIACFESFVIVSVTLVGVIQCLALLLPLTILFKQIPLGPLFELMAIVVGLLTVAAFVAIWIYVARFMWWPDDRPDPSIDADGHRAVDPTTDQGS